MKSLAAGLMGTAFALALAVSATAQAGVVDSGFRSGPWADFGVITLENGSYSLELTAIGSGGPLLFGLIGQDVAEAYQVNLGNLPGTVSTQFTTVGGTFDWLVGGPGPFTVFTASVNKEVESAGVPEPGALTLLGLGLAALGFARRKRVQTEPA